MAAVLALDVGGTKLAAAVVDDSGRILGRGRVPSPTGTDPEQLYEALLACAAAALRGADVQPRPTWTGSAWPPPGPWCGPRARSPRSTCPPGAASRSASAWPRSSTPTGADPQRRHRAHRRRALEGRRRPALQPARHDRLHRGRRRPHPRRPPRTTATAATPATSATSWSSPTGRPAPAAGAAAWRRSPPGPTPCATPSRTAGAPGPECVADGVAWPRRPRPGTSRPAACGQGRPGRRDGRRLLRQPARSRGRGHLRRLLPVRPDLLGAAPAGVHHPRRLPVRRRLPGRPRPAGRGGRPARRGRLRARPRSLRLGPRPGHRVTRMGLWLRTESGG